MRRCLLLSLVLFASAPVLADEPHAILSEDVKYDPAIPTPRSYLGYGIGERHIQHHERSCPLSIGVSVIA